MPLEPGRGVTDSSLQVEIFHKRFHQPSSFADRFGIMDIDDTLIPLLQLKEVVAEHHLKHL